MVVGLDIVGSKRRKMYRGTSDARRIDNLLNKRSYD